MKLLDSYPIDNNEIALKSIWQHIKVSVSFDTIFILLGI